MFSCSRSWQFSLQAQFNLTAYERFLQLLNGVGILNAGIHVRWWTDHMPWVGHTWPVRVPVISKYTQHLLVSHDTPCPLAHVPFSRLECSKPSPLLAPFSTPIVPPWGWAMLGGTGSDLAAGSLLWMKKMSGCSPTTSWKDHVRASWLSGIAPATPPPRPFVQHELQLEKQSWLSVPWGFPPTQPNAWVSITIPHDITFGQREPTRAQDIWSQYLKTLKSCMSFQTFKDFRSFQLLSYIFPSCFMQKGFLMFKFHSEDLGKCIFHAILTRKKPQP